MVLRRALVVALVAGLGVAGWVAAKRTGDTVQARRLDDRRELTKAFAGPLTDWFDEGVMEAETIVAAVDRVPAGAGGALFAFGEQPHRFGREALVLDRGLRRLAGSPRLFDSSGAVLACRDQQRVVLDNGLLELAQAASASPGPLVRAFDDPTCTPHVYTAGQGFIDPVSSGHVHLLWNRTDKTAKTVSVQLIAAGQPRRIDAPAPGSTTAAVSSDRFPSVAAARAVVAVSSQTGPRRKYRRHRVSTQT